MLHGTECAPEANASKWTLDACTSARRQQAMWVFTSLMQQEQTWSGWRSTTRHSNSKWKC